ncbi:translation initiation factor IF-2 [Desulfofalx alkaliphila]|uniref:translation initiation factor IF-2 n=1 Tax=Desulfofalx alkaliphila TaxID=105483 RepID=UPI0004E17DA6|nr:translation initiation factor IF-2 [Desulfofalx alkaliphila]
MTKKRVHELAKELNVESKDVINKLSSLGVTVKSVLATVEEQYVEKLKAMMEPKKSHDVKGSERKKKEHNRGPGLVDRVPSRPPDRRFDERKSEQAGNTRQGQSGQKGQHQSKQGKAASRGGQQGRPGNRGGQQGKADRGGQQGRPGSRGGQPGKTASRDSQQGKQLAQHKRTSKDKEIAIPKPDPVVSAQAKAKAQERPRPEQRGKANKMANKDRWIEQKERQEKFKSQKRRPQKKRFDKKSQEKQQPGQPVEKKPITIGESLTVQELAEKLRRTAADVIKTLMGMGLMATINQEIDADTATIVANEFGYDTIVKVKEDIEELVMAEPEDDSEELELRPPVVTVMGHVDHGKTSLLDAIREANVTATEAGGITQHIGAYQVEKNGKKITFLDTPGHAAFTAMRARGAKVTDIAILVVAADDGVMPQTVEAINHAKAADVPIIVAINKIDKPQAAPDRVRQELTQHGLVVEQWGGDVISVEVSALKQTGLEELLEMILLVSEISELKANPNRLARGTVVEAELDKGRGPVATVLVQNGTLKVGDPVVVGRAYGRVRAMMDYFGRRVKKAGPSTPVEVLGLNDVPEAGDILVAVEDEKIARAVAEKRQNRKREEEMKLTNKLSLDDLFKHIKAGNIKELPIIIKADVQGSVEALSQSLERLSNEEVKITMVHGGVGAITETDIMLASASNAIIIGFNVRPDVNARKAAETENVDIRLYQVIYSAIEDMKAAMSGLLDPEYKEVVIGRVEVRKTFKVSRIGTIAGSYVLEGKITRDSGVRVIRDGIVIHEGKIEALKRFKDDAKEVPQGYECGITLEKFNDFQEGDIIEPFVIEEVKRELA